jgi:hypothetical protein
MAESRRASRGRAACGNNSLRSSSRSANILDEWGASGIAVLDAVAEGIPTGRLVGGVLDGLPIVTKAGGFGAPDALVAAVNHLAGAEPVGSGSREARASQPQPAPPLHHPEERT